MSMAAIWETYCCSRLFVMGRYKGNSGSSGSYMCRIDCQKCGVHKPAIGHANASFFTLVDDENLKTKDVRRRILNPREEAYVRGTVRGMQPPNEADKKQAPA